MSDSKDSPNNIEVVAIDEKYRQGKKLTKYYVKDNKVNSAELFVYNVHCIQHSLNKLQFSVRQVLFKWISENSDLFTQSKELNCQDVQR